MVMGVDVQPDILPIDTHRPPVSTVLDMCTQRVSPSECRLVRLQSAYAFDCLGEEQKGHCSHMLTECHIVPQ